MKVPSEAEPGRGQIVSREDYPPVCKPELILEAYNHPLAEDHRHLSFKELGRGALALGVAAVAITGVVVVNAAKKLHQKLPNQ